MFKSGRQQGDSQREKQWLTEIYDAYHPPIYRYIFWRVGEMESARELTADVFQRLVQLVRRGKTFPENPQAWLYQTAHNIVIDEYRRRQHRQHLPLNEAILDSHDDPAEEAAIHLAAAQARDALKLLTPEQQQVITLKFLAGLTNQEIAATTGKSIGAVKALQHRGLAALQQALNPDATAGEPLVVSHPPAHLVEVVIHPPKT
jgi:RNA polymerase sigma-70 factor, ECF subfamily